MLRIKKKPFKLNCHGNSYNNSEPPGLGYDVIQTAVIYSSVITLGYIRKR